MIEIAVEVLYPFPCMRNLLVSEIHLTHEPFGSVRNYHVVGVRQDEKKVVGSR